MATHTHDTGAGKGTAPRDHDSSPLRVERSPKRVRALVSGRPVFDTRAAMLVWEKPYYPTYYVPRTDVLAELVESRHGHGRVAHADLGPARAMDVRVAGSTRAGAVLAFPEAPDPVLRELVRPRWSAMDEWLEEDEPVYVHPRDPYKRIDVLASSRHVRVVVDGVTVADSRQPRILFETGLPPRFYLPLSDVRTDLLRPTDTVSHCPYKGTASWWSLQLESSRHDDIAWTYRLPTAESQKIAGLVAFYDERVDLHLDGELQPRPVTPFS
jgi:uncharacterized protein (DUF427 family)